MIQLTSEKLQGGSVTRIQGALDGRTYQQFSDQVKQQVDAEGRAILDFKDVESVNSEGLRALLALNHWIKARNGSLIVVGLSGQAQEAFKSSGCDRLLKSYPDTATAMQAEGMSAAASVSPQGPQSPPQPAYSQSPPPASEIPTIPARSQPHVPQSTVPPRAETEWVKRASPVSTPVATPKKAKGSLPILPIVGAVLALVAIVGLIVIFVLPSNEETQDPEVVSYPEISAQASYELQVGEATNIAISTRYSESLKVEGSLPTGLELESGASSDEWTLEGTPEESGTFQITLVATGSGGDETIESTRLLVAAAEEIDQTPAQPVIQTDSLPEAIVNQSYSAKINSTGTASLSASGLPEGLSLAANGDLTGTLQTAGTYQITLTATGEGGSASKTLDLTVSERQTSPEELQDGPDLIALKADLEERVMLAQHDPTVKENVRKRIPLIKRATKVFTVPFSVGDTDMRESEKQLLRLAISENPEVKAIKETTGVMFFALGYADPTGSREANIELSRKRAQSVADYLESSPTNLGNVLAVPMGPTDILDESRREGNRAVEVWAIVP